MPRCPSGVEVEVTGGAVGALAQAHAATGVKLSAAKGLVAGPKGDADVLA